MEILVLYVVVEIALQTKRVGFGKLVLYGLNGEYSVNIQTEISESS